MATLLDRVESYLQSVRGAGYCNDCLAILLDVPSVDHITFALAAARHSFTSEFDRCDRCGRNRRIMRAF